MSAKIARAIARAEHGQIARHAADLVANPAWRAVLLLATEEIKNRWADAAMGENVHERDLCTYELRALTRVLEAMQRAANQLVRKGIQ